MENKKILGIFAAVFMIVAVVGFASAQALPDEFPAFHGFGMMGPFGFEGNQTAMQDIWSAVSNDNYQAWVSAVESQLTQANFDKLVNRSRDMNQTRLRDPDFNWTNQTEMGMWANPDHMPRFGNWTGNWTGMDDHPGFGDLNQTRLRDRDFNWTNQTAYNGANPGYMEYGENNGMESMGPGFSHFGRNRGE